LQSSIRNVPPLLGTLKPSRCKSLREIRAVRTISDLQSARRRLSAVVNPGCVREGGRFVNFGLSKTSYSFLAFMCGSRIFSSNLPSAACSDHGGGRVRSCRIVFLERALLQPVSFLLFVQSVRHGLHKISEQPRWRANQRFPGTVCPFTDTIPHPLATSQALTRRTHISVASL